MATTVTQRADPELRRTAERHLEAGEWKQAIRCYNRMVDRDPECELKRNLARNLAALEEHQPAAYAGLMATPPSANYEIRQTRHGLTVAHIGEHGKATLLSPGGDPARGVREALADLEPRFEQGEAIGLASIGDGYLLAELAARDDRTPMGARTGIHLFEPDPALLLMVMHLHDYSGPRGPIRQPHFEWYLGDAWAEQLRSAVFEAPSLSLPLTFARLGVNSRAIQSRAEEVTSQVVEWSDGLHREIESYYADVSAADLAALLGDAPPRPPRVMFVTTRFSTVLQYSTRDAAAALEQLGWRCRTVIEPTDHHRITATFIRAHLAEFQPDVVWVLDHLRREYSTWFPDNLPFVCWIQDHLPGLGKVDAGRSVKRRDFVLAHLGSAPVYRRLYRYPPRQTVDMPKLTRMPSLPASRRNDGEDMVYVSNWSRTPEQVIDEVLTYYAPPKVRPITERCCRRLIEHYEGGGSVATFREARRLLEPLIDRAAPNLDAEDRYRAMFPAFDRLNNCLYRQQALKWAAGLARSHGLSLGIYGRGWDRHPDLAEFDRGPVEYGEALEELTRRTKINLQIVPYFCFHQRLLDGLAAGGFFLVRHHPADRLLPRLVRWIEAGEPVPDELAEEARGLCELGDQADPVEIVRGYREAGALLDDGGVLPELDEVSFTGREDFEQLVLRHLADEDRRREIANVQRRSIAHRFSYVEGLRRVTRWMSNLLAEEAATDGRGRPGEHE